MSYTESITNDFGNSFSEKSIRHAFIRKVYSIIMVQFVVTSGFIALFLFIPQVKQFSIEHPEFFWTVLVFSFVFLIALTCCENVRRSFPTNLIFLILFTICQSLVLGVTASHFDTDAVLMAAGICVVVCLGLTIFAFQTKIDFTICSGFLMVSVLILFCFGIIAIIFPSKVMQILYAAIGAAIFSLYLVFDTQMMMGETHRYSLSPEEYIFAALSIYLDVINIFLMILQLIRSISSD